MELTVLAVPDCPNVPVLMERLSIVLADHPDARLVHRVVRDQASAARLGMRGSPTLLVNGTDPFASPGTPASLSCRIYRDETGQTRAAPSVAALRAAIGRAADGPSGGPVLPDVAGRAGLGRLAPADGGLRAVQQLVLRTFAETGRAPTAAELDRAAAPSGSDGVTVLDRLHAADFIRLDGDGGISAAYPFSAVPTPHVVQIHAGPEVFSMCAIDALGIASMLGRPVKISSAEPATGSPITVTLSAGGDRAVWEPAGTVVFAGQLGTCGAGTGPGAAVPWVAAEECCGFINFFTTRDRADAWARAHPGVTGQTLGQKAALKNAIQIFGRLLRPALTRPDN